MEKGEPKQIDLTEDDLLFMTIGSLTENSDDGDHHTPARLNTGPAPAWDLWRKIAGKDPSFGNPMCSAPTSPRPSGESATVTTLDPRIPEYNPEDLKRDPSAAESSPGIVTVMDSNWLMSWTVNRQPHFKKQPKDQIVAWITAGFSQGRGDYVKKPMQDCTGEEITRRVALPHGRPGRPDRRWRPPAPRCRS